METFSVLLAPCAGNSPAPGEFPAQRPVTRSFDVFFDLRLNKRLSKQPWGWRFETPLCSLWRQCNDAPPSHLNQACSQPIMSTDDSSIEGRSTTNTRNVHIGTSLYQDFPDRGVALWCPQEGRLGASMGPLLGVHFRPSVEQQSHNIRMSCMTQWSEPTSPWPMYIFTADIRVCSIVQQQSHSFKVIPINRPYQRVGRHWWL